MANMLQEKVLTIIQEPLRVYTIGDDAYQNGSGRGILVTRMKSAFEYIRFLTDIYNPLRRLLISISIA